MAGPLKHRWSIAHNYLAGITADKWWRLLRENGFAVSPAYWHRAAFISVLSLLNAASARRETKRHGAQIAATPILHPPIFILGHWRSGTTHLHNLLAQDPQFAFPNTYQVVNPATFLTTEEANVRRFAWLVPKKRLMDNMALSFASPQEEEFAPALLSLRSLYLGMSFPRAMPRYARYLTFDAACSDEREAWQNALQLFLRKLTFRHGQRPLLLKSPSHTAKVRMLLELFPAARFVHIHRHPYEVYQSQHRFYDTVLWHTYLQRPNRARVSDEILERYQTLFAAYFRDQPLIPPGQFHELSFNELERDPLGAVERTYAALGIQNFATARPRLEAYVATLRDYEKNRFAPLDAATRARIDTVAAPCFERWGYAR